MNIEELKRLAEAATPGPWVVKDELSGTVYANDIPVAASIRRSPKLNTLSQFQKESNSRYIAAANPAAVLELIAEVDRQRGYADDLTIALESSEKQLKDSRANDYTAIGYLADCRVAVGDNGKRMLPEFVEYLRQLRQQRDELLAALKDARELVNDWGAYASAYMQEKHDLAGDLDRLDAAISKVEK